MPVRDLLNVKEAAEEIGCTDAHVRRMLIDKIIVGIKATERAWLIPREEVLRFIRQERRKGGRPRISD